MSQHLQSKQILGGYEIEKLIGKGGMGEVYRARQINLDRIVALKILPPSVAQRNPDYARRFLEEAQAAGCLNHPNIIAVYNVGKASPLYADPSDPEINYFSMEYVKGKSVQRIIDAQGILPQKLIYRIMVGMTKALIYAEAHGIVHRDIKPDNIMVTTEGVIKLADLGLALRSDNRDEIQNNGTLANNRVVGTPRYMSPEQARGLVIDARSDQYSLGATLYHMFTGKPPYSDGNAKDILRAHVSDPVRDPKEINPTISEAWRQICMRLMAKNPDERYANFQGLRTAITEALKKPTAIEEKPTQDRLSRSQQRRTAAKQQLIVYVPLGVTGLLIATLVIVMISWGGTDQSGISENNKPPVPDNGNSQLTISDSATGNVEVPTPPNNTIPNAVREDDLVDKPLTISLDEKVDADKIIAQTIHNGELVEINYGINNHKWFLRDFTGENMDIVNNALIWSNNETFIGRNEGRDIPSITWKGRLFPPFSISAQINIRPNTNGFAVGAVIYGSDNIGRLACIRIDNTYLGNKCHYGIYSYSKKQNSNIQFRKNTKIIPFTSSELKTFKVNIDQNYEASVFIDDEQLFKSFRLENCMEIKPFFQIIKTNSIETVIEIRSLKITGKPPGAISPE